jgi:hypothetical protein
MPGSVLLSCKEDRDETAPSVNRRDDGGGGSCCPRPMYVLDLGLKRSPLLVGFWTSLSKQKSQIAGLVVFEMFYAPLMALVASFGGMFAIMIGSSPRKKERAAQPS